MSHWVGVLSLGWPGVFAMVTTFVFGVTLLWVALGRREWSWLAALVALPCAFFSLFVPTVASYGLISAFLCLLVVAPASLLVTESTATNRLRALGLLALVFVALTSGSFLPESVRESCALGFVIALIVLVGAPVAVLLLLPEAIRKSRLLLAIGGSSALILSIGIWLLRAHFYRP